MGQLRKRGRIWWIRYYRNGQRIEESTGFTKYDEARDVLKKREGAVADGVPITARSTRFTFDDAVKDVVSDYKVNGKKSLKGLERKIRLHLTPAFGGRRLSAISVADLRALQLAQRLCAFDGSMRAPPFAMLTIWSVQVARTRRPSAAQRECSTWHTPSWRCPHHGKCRSQSRLNACHAGV
jgi:hypothetical protein